ncbi:MAG: class I SAM-dependent methyltransferase [Gemmatimonadetes bacterium]|nr:class I SAM-dependent methyltransferase [Gemmatimonadota bacterium]
MTHVEYGWKDAAQKSSHEYLLPAALAEVARIGGGRPLRILDLGCGNGFIAAELARRGHQVVGVDVSEDGIEVARAAYDLPNLRFHVHSVYDPGLDELVSGGVECVLSLEVVEHLYLPRALFTESRRVLAPGGALVASTPYHGYLKNLAISLAGGWDRHFGVDWDGGHVKFFSPATMRRMAEEAGLGRIRFRGVGRVPLLWKSMIMVAER